MASPLRKLVLDYLEEVELDGRSDRTARNYGGYLDRFTGWLHSILGKKAEDLVVEDITPEVLRQYRLYLARRRDARTGRPIGATTRNLHLIALRQFLRYCQRRRKLVVADPEENLQLAKERDVGIRRLEPQEVARIARAIPLDSPTGLRDRAVVEALFGTAVRVSELVSLTTRQVDLEHRAAEVVGKGGRARLVLLTKDAAYWIRHYLETRTDNSPHLFVSRLRSDDGAPRRLSVRQVQRIVAEAAQRAGIPFRVSPHWFRHARLSLVATYSGVHVAQRVAGHSSLATTSRYANVGDAALRSLYDRADEAAKAELGASSKSDSEAQQ